MKRSKRRIADQIGKGLYPLIGKSGKTHPKPGEIVAWLKGAKALYRMRCGGMTKVAFFGIDESARLWKAVSRKIEGKASAYEYKKQLLSNLLLRRV